jgi:hypothetical protein
MLVAVTLRVTKPDRTALERLEFNRNQRSAEKGCVYDIEIKGGADNGGENSPEFP